MASAEVPVTDIRSAPEAGGDRVDIRLQVEVRNFEQLSELIHVARDNERLVERLHRLSIALLDAPALDGRKLALVFSAIVLVVAVSGILPPMSGSRDRTFPGLDKATLSPVNQA